MHGVGDLFRWATLRPCKVGLIGYLEHRYTNQLIGWLDE